MRGYDGITLRPVEPSDLDHFYAHQLDPAAIRMAAFVSAERKNRPAFDAHWDKILRAPENTNRTIIADGQVAGHIACFPRKEIWRSPTGWAASSGAEASPPRRSTRCSA